MIHSNFWQMLLCKFFFRQSQHYVFPLHCFDRNHNKCYPPWRQIAVLALSGKDMAVKLIEVCFFSNSEDNKLSHKKCLEFDFACFSYKMKECNFKDSLSSRILCRHHTVISLRLSENQFDLKGTIDRLSHWHNSVIISVISAIGYHLRQIWFSECWETSAWPQKTLADHASLLLLSLADFIAFRWWNFYYYLVKCSGHQEGWYKKWFG